MNSEPPTNMMLSFLKPILSGPGAFLGNMTLKDFIERAIWLSELVAKMIVHYRNHCFHKW